MTRAASSPWARELAVAREAAREASELLAAAFARTGDEPGLAYKREDDPVTAADLAASARIEAALARSFPGDARLGEEIPDDPRRLSARRVWIFDPLDGTRAFVDRIPEFAVSIALVEAGRPRVAVVQQPASKVAVWAVAGGGTRRGEGPGDGEPVRVSARTRLDEALLLASRRETRSGALDAWAARVREVRAVSSIAWKLALVATGEAELQLTTRAKNEWDVCAGDLLVCEAGGCTLDGSGRAPRYNRPHPEIPAPLAAGNPALLRALRGHAD